VLLVGDDQAEPAIGHGGEDGRSRAEHDVGGSVGGQRPLLMTLRR
jgi:hypothetical protein